ncbi:hypothetical protein BT63DRAFT_430190 [Microthyrium microscopicum]|uniref:Uncharacterized protein n=1 Tax=Microthyrium microscopicum TaxID=703497 RepID=A0A6A6TY71_9PEZI|nr:hypothetical protein BT63DRAFT_430190 [Microthyrium microscopicum]
MSPRPSQFKDLSIKSEVGEPTSPTSSTYSAEPNTTAADLEESIQSPTSKSFFGAISTKFNKTRSRSPSPAPPQANTPRATTPKPRNSRTVSQQITSSTPMSPTSTMTSYHASRQFSSDSTATAVSIDSPTRDSFSAPSPKRTDSSQSNFQRMSYGRHSGDWLFGGASFTNAMKKTFRPRRDS